MAYRRFQVAYENKNRNMIEHMICDTKILQL